MTGSRPRPTALKVLQGERPSRINDDEPAFAPGVPRKPERFDDPDVATTWDALIEALEPTGMLSAGDGFALMGFAQTWVSFERACALVNSVGPMVLDPKHQPRRNPATFLATQANHDVLAWCREFGMTPAARSQIRSRLAGGLPRQIADAVADRFLG
jgi:P27 family predicted phage terminase small subunit